MKPELLRALPKMDLLLARPALAGSPLPYALRRQAERLMAPYARDEGFAFWEVEG